MAYQDNPENPISSAAMKVMTRPPTTYPDMEVIVQKESITTVYERYATVFLRHGWLLISVLAFSSTFRHAALTIDGDVWDEIIGCAATNALSLEMFAKVRALDIAYALQNLLEFIPTVSDVQIADDRVSNPHADASIFIRRNAIPPVTTPDEHSFVIAATEGYTYRPSSACHH